jgi:hypothetical protein
LVGWGKALSRLHRSQNADQISRNIRYSGPVFIKRPYSHRWEFGQKSNMRASLQSNSMSTCALADWKKKGNLATLHSTSRGAVHFEPSRSLLHFPYVLHHFSLVLHVFHLELFLAKCARSKNWGPRFSFYCAQIWCSPTYDMNVAYKPILGRHTIPALPTPL